MTNVMRVISEVLYEQLMDIAKSRLPKSEGHKSKEKLDVGSLERFIPENYRKRARKLRLFFETTNSVKWNEKIEIILNDSALLNSHIVDYKMFLICGPIGRKEDPPYWKPVTQKLMIHNPPLNLFGKAFMTKYQTLPMKTAWETPSVYENVINRNKKFVVFMPVYVMSDRCLLPLIPQVYIYNTKYNIYIYIYIYILHTSSLIIITHIHH